jgi:hypothetical protein
LDFCVPGLVQRHGQRLCQARVRNGRRDAVATASMQSLYVQHFGHPSGGGGCPVNELRTFTQELLPEFTQSPLSSAVSACLQLELNSIKRIRGRREAGDGRAVVLLRTRRG